MNKNIMDDEELRELVEQSVERSNELGIDFAACSFTAAPEGEDVPPNSREYSCVGTSDVANSHYIAQYADLANDLVNIMGLDEARSILESHLTLLNSAMWSALDASKGEHARDN